VSHRISNRFHRIRAWFFRGWHGDCSKCPTPINNSGRWCDEHDPSLVVIELDETPETVALVAQAEAMAKAEGIALSVLMGRVIDEMIRVHERE